MGNPEEASSTSGIKEDGAYYQALSAAYQVTARLLAAEQAGIWSRMAMLLALTGAVAAFLSKFGSGFNTVITGALGLVVCVVLFYSGRRGFNFRDDFVSLMLRQESELGIKSFGPLNDGKVREYFSAQAGKPRGGLNQRRTHCILISVAAAVYVAILVFGICSLLSSSETPQPCACASASAAAHR